MKKKEKKMKTKMKMGKFISLMLTATIVYAWCDADGIISYYSSIYEWVIAKK